MKNEQLQRELSAQEDIANQNRNFVKSLFHDAEKDRRETQRQNIITAFNMAGQGAQSMLMNPKFLAKAAYLLVIGFGAFHMTRLIVAVITTGFLARMGKPQLVRETSKLHSQNLVTLPFAYARKVLHTKMKRTEKDLLQGVILEKNLED